MLVCISTLTIRKVNKMGDDVGKSLPLIMTVGGAIVGGYVGGTLGAAMGGAAVGATTGTMAQQAFFDPYEDIEAQMARNAEINRQSIAEWQAQQKKMWEAQQHDVEQMQGFKDEFMNAYMRGDVASSSMFAPMFANLRAQERQALARVEEMPAGGAKDRAVRQINTAFADAQSNLLSQAQRAVFQMASQMNIPYQMTGAPALMPPQEIPYRPGAEAMVGPLAMLAGMSMGEPSAKTQAKLTPTTMGSKLGY